MDIKLQAVIIGALVAILGGFINQYFLSRRQDLMERKSIRREKLEELYNLSNKIVETIGTEIAHLYQSVTNASMSVDENANRHPYVINDMELIVDLYHRDLRISFEEFKSKFDNFYKLKNELSVSVMSGKNETAQNQIMHTSAIRSNE